MNTEVRRRRWLLLVVLSAQVLVPAVLTAQETSVLDASVEWRTGVLHATLTRPVQSGAADGVARSQRAIEREMADHLVSLLVEVTLSSAATVAERLQEREELVSLVTRVASNARPVRAYASPDLQHARVEYEIDLFAELVPGLVEHRDPAPIDEFLGWHPGGQYTGVLIVADDLLPQFGQTSSARLSPALFPGYYYTAGTPPLLYRIAEADHIRPEALAGNGPVLYVSDLADPRLAGRVGPRPIRLLARGVFGDHPTDVVLGESDARTLLASRETIELLRSGRVAIVVHPEQLEG